jgi:hypothetical protein
MKTQLMIRLTAVAVTALGLSAQLYSPEAQASGCNGVYTFCVSQVYCSTGAGCLANKPAGCTTLNSWACQGFNIEACPNFGSQYQIRCLFS